MIVPVGLTFLGTVIVMGSHFLSRSLNNLLKVLIRSLRKVKAFRIFNLILKFRVVQFRLVLSIKLMTHMRRMINGSASVPKVDFIHNEQRV